MPKAPFCQLCKRRAYWTVTVRGLDASLEIVSDDTMTNLNLCDTCASMLGKPRIVAKIAPPHPLPKE